MDLKEGMLCKHFKGHDLYEKNIYRILKANVDGSLVDFEIVNYSGDYVKEDATNLVIYQNIVDGKIFAREYADLTGEISLEKQMEYNQKYRVEPLTDDEIEIVISEEFLSKRKRLIRSK